MRLNSDDSHLKDLVSGDRFRYVPAEGVTERLVGDRTAHQNLHRTDGLMRHLDVVVGDQRRPGGVQVNGWRKANKLIRQVDTGR